MTSEGFCKVSEYLEKTQNCVHPALLAHQGIKAVLAESYERIHRSNLVGMGVIPLEYLPGENADTLGLTGRERYTVSIPENLKPRMKVQVKVSRSACTPHPAERDPVFETSLVRRKSVGFGRENCHSLGLR